MTHGFMEKEERRLWAVLNECRLNFESKMLEAESKVSYEQYGQGGLVLHRGFYCPSLICDVVVGNCNRGRLRKTAPDNPDYIYGFNSTHQLVTVKKIVSCSIEEREFVFTDGQTEIGIGSPNNYNTSFTISECKYDGNRLLSYAFGFSSSLFPHMVELREEQYTYLENEMHVERYLFVPNSPPMVDKHYKYCFRVENGILASYTEERYTGDSCKKDDRVFKALKRRIPGY